MLRLEWCLLRAALRFNRFSGLLFAVNDTDFV